MDINKLKNSSYLDILFDGKNKQYGSYELRQKYPRRALIAGLVSLLVVGGAFGSTLINLKKEDVVEVVAAPEMKAVELAEPPPLKPNEPPPPPPPTAPPPVKPTVAFTVPEIKKDTEVPKEQKIKEPPKEKDNAVVGIKTQEGSNDPGALDPGLSNLPSGNGPKVPVTAGTGSGSGSGPSTEIFRAVEKMPAPPYDFNKYLSKTVKYPNKALEAGIQGTVSVEFIVGVDGSISNVRVVKGDKLGAGLSEEAIRVVKAAPKWTAGQQNGKAVPVYFTVPVNFKLQ